MAGFNPATHCARVCGRERLFSARKRAGWVAGLKPAMTVDGAVFRASNTGQAHPEQILELQSGLTSSFRERKVWLMRLGFVYILTNKPFGTLYTGVTNDLIGRVHKHRQGTASVFTKRYGITMLVWYETHESVVAAIQRETSIKRWKRDWKIDLVNKMNPEWRDLFDGLGR